MAPFAADLACNLQFAIASADHRYGLRAAGTGDHRCGFGVVARAARGSDSPARRNLCWWALRAPGTSIRLRRGRGRRADFVPSRTPDHRSPETAATTFADWSCRCGAACIARRGTLL